MAPLLELVRRYYGEALQQELVGGFDEISLPGSDGTSTCCNTHTIGLHGLQFAPTVLLYMLMTTKWLW